MKQLLTYFKDFHKSGYNIYTYISIVVLISFILYFDYQFHIISNFIRHSSSRNAQALKIILFNAIVYFGALYIVKKFSRSPIQHYRKFVFFSTIVVLLFGIERSIIIYLNEYRQAIPTQIYRYVYYILANFTSLLVLLVPVIILKSTIDKREPFGLYGLQFSKTNFSMYWFLLLCIIPLTFAASFNSSFLDYYPTYKRTHGFDAAQYLQIPEYICLLFYEFVYITDFLFTELTFRGLLVIGMIRYLGKDAILPMVSLYAVVHLGKPLGEAISSVFGGYLLGVIAYQSKNIWGGVFLHCGLALCMEIFAFI